MWAMWVKADVVPEKGINIQVGVVALSNRWIKKSALAALGRCYNFFTTGFLIRKAIIMNSAEF